MSATRTEHGFQFGPALVESFAETSNGGVVIGITTPKNRAQIYITKSGLIRITRDDFPEKVKVQEQQGEAS